MNNIDSKNWRKRTKERMVLSMGGKCQVCDYSRNAAAFDFHHIDPTTKLIGLSGAKSNHLGWGKIVIELKKCLILCSNCHRELHSGELHIGGMCCPFDEQYADYKSLLLDKEKRKCPICEEVKHFDGVTCSRSCAGRKAWKVDWDKYDVLELLTSGETYASIGRLVGCSDKAVRKRVNTLER